jgi:hypothetical protein
VDGKKSWLTRLASEETLREKATAFKTALLSGDGAPWVNEADALSPSLIRRWDARKASAHCDATCADADALASHRAACAFRPVPCPHGGCFEVVSAGRLAEHEGVCGHKPLPCVLGCPMLVKKKDMTVHVAGPCDARPVECPFAYLGCKDACTLGGRATHLETAAAAHLSLLSAATAALGRTVEAQAPLISEVAAHLAPLRAGGGLSKQLGACVHACVHACACVMVRLMHLCVCVQLRRLRLRRRLRSAPRRRSAAPATRSASCAPQRRVHSCAASACAHAHALLFTRRATFRVPYLSVFLFGQSELKDAREETRKLRDEFKSFKGALRCAATHASHRAKHRTVLTFVCFLWARPPARSDGDGGA